MIHRGPALAVPTFFTVLAALASGCDNSAPGPGAAKLVPAEAAVASQSRPTSGPGTLIVRDLRVPVGAGLLGTAFPTIPPSEQRPSAWRATLMAGAPLRAVNDLVQQMRRLSPYGQSGCVAELGDGSGRPLTAVAASEKVGRVECQLVGYPKLKGGWMYRLNLRYGRYGSQAQSHITMEAGPGSPRDLINGRHHRAGMQPIPWLPEIRVPAPGAPPAVGDRVAQKFDFDHRGLRIEAGSVLLGPPLVGTCAGGFSAVLRLTDDPQRVFDQYVDQLHKGATSVHTFNVGGQLLREHQSADTGGVHILVQSLTADAGSIGSITATVPTFLAVDNCND